MTIIMIIYKNDNNIQVTITMIMIMIICNDNNNIQVTIIMIIIIFKIIIIIYK